MTSIDCPLGSFYVNISGIPNVPVGYIPHGDPHLKGEGVFTFHDDIGSMDWTMKLSSSSRYTVTQAHIYNLDLVPEGDSWACWGGRWSPHEYLEGTGFDILYGITSDDIAADTWVIMLHTEGGHFAIDDETGNLVVYDAELHETSVTGIKETGKRFNNRVPRTLTNRLLREVNLVSGRRGEKDFDAEFPDPNHFLRTHDEPFPDAHGNVWITWDESSQRYIPSAFGFSHNLTIKDIDSVEYLFYLYDDQGPEWDWGGPEGAGGGVLIPCAELPTHRPTHSPTWPPTISPMVSKTPPTALNLGTNASAVDDTSGSSFTDAMTIFSEDSSANASKSKDLYRWLFFELVVGLSAHLTLV